MSEDNDLYNIMKRFNKLQTSKPKPVVKEEYKHMSPEARKIAQQIEAQEQAKKRGKK